VADDKLFTVEEASALLPQLRLLMERLQRHALRLDAEMHDLARARRREALAEREGGAPTLAALDIEELLRARPALRLIVEELDATVDRIAELGGHLKDIRLGLVDFPTLLDGERVLLCWQFGEDDIVYWHAEDQGFDHLHARPRPRFHARRLLPGATPVQRLQ
jgi:hypothetical protein